MLLTPSQRDALSELLNMALARAAAPLSELAGQRVLLEVPRFDLFTITRLRSLLKELLPGEAARVHQSFDGPISGDAMLLLSYPNAVHLAGMLSGNHQSKDCLDTSSMDVLLEVGNILFNACLALFGEVAQVRFTFAVPRIHVGAVDTLLESVIAESEESSCALVAYTGVRIPTSEMVASLLLVVGVTGLEQLIQAIEEWAVSQRVGNLVSAERR
ncbi:MAG: hypothetical protein ACYC35_15725 [Pirellulales bacterium]